MTKWLRNYPEYNRQDWREAEAALRTFGTNAIPHIIGEFTRPVPLSRNVHFRIWYYGPVWVKNLVGVPQFQRFDNTFAPQVFGAIGTSSIPVLVGYLDSRDPAVQIAAARGLAWFGPNSRSSLPKLRECLDQGGGTQAVTQEVRKALMEIYREEAAKTDR